MRLHNLILENIGPIKKAELEFISDESQLNNPPVICITGENGTGKSIILDAIRSLFKGRFSSVERDITSSQNFLIKTNLQINNSKLVFSTNTKFEGEQSLDTNNIRINQLFHSQFEPHFKKDFILDYWTSKLSNDNFSINSITSVDAKKYLDDSLSGIHKNVDLTKIISFFDYLKDSTESSEFADAVEANLRNLQENTALYKRRQMIIEHIFGTVKRKWGFGYTDLRGLPKVNGEFSLIMTVYNLKRTINILGTKDLLQKIKTWKPDYKKLSLALKPSVFGRVYIT